jgi:hypothetical protein
VGADEGASKPYGRTLHSPGKRPGADPVLKGRPWSLPLKDRVLLVAAYCRTNHTPRQLAPLFKVSKSAADRIIDHLGPSLALQQRKRFRKDTVLRRLASKSKVRSDFSLGNPAALIRRSERRRARSSHSAISSSARKPR